MWYQKFDTYILSLGFVRSKVDHCVYSKEEGGHFIYVALYVDDMLLVRKQHGCYKGGEDATILQVQHEGSQCCELHSGNGDQERSGKLENFG
jgi:hypothetical protein